MFIGVNGIRLYFDVAGAQGVADGPRSASRPTIILLHGGPGMDHWVFKPAFDRLADHAQLIYLDQRGCGRSDRGDPAEWRLDQWADDVAEFVALLGIKRPIIVGTSFGGLVAQRVAARHRGLAAGLVLMATVAKPSLPASLDAIEERGGHVARQAATKFFDDPLRDGVIEHYFAACLDLYAARGIKIDVMARVGSNPQVMASFLGSGGEFHSLDLRGDVADSSLPVLVVHGEDDPIFPMPLALQMFDGLASERKQFVAIRDCSHLIEQDAPDEAIDAICAFFDL